MALRCSGGRVGRMRPAIAD